MSWYVIVPLLVANFSLTCNHGTAPDLPSDSPDTTEVLVSASVPGDVEGLSSVQLRLTTAAVCEGEDDAAGVDEHAEVLVFDELCWSDEAGGSRKSCSWTWRRGATTWSWWRLGTASGWGSVLTTWWSSAGAARGRWAAT